MQLENKPYLPNLIQKIKNHQNPSYEHDHQVSSKHKNQILITKTPTFSCRPNTDRKQQKLTQIQKQEYKTKEQSIKENRRKTKKKST